MPTGASRKNPLRPGDVVHLNIQGNGFGEGHLWRVNKVKGNNVWIEVVLTITGVSKLRKKKVLYHELNVPSLDTLRIVKSKLDNIIDSVAKQLARPDEAAMDPTNYSQRR